MDYPGFTLSIVAILASISTGFSNKGVISIKEQPANVVAKRNDPATLHCAVEGASKVSWFKDGHRLDLQQESDHRLMVINGCSLFFLRVLSNKRETDDGVYWFEATNHVSSVRSSNATMLVASLGDAFFEPPNPLLKALQGAPLTLHCRPPKGSPPPTVSWKHNGRTVTNSSRQVTTPEGDLVFHNVLEGDVGQYVCVADNVAGARESQPSTVIVMKSPEFDVKPQNVSTIGGSSVEFECIARGNPPPSVTWRKLEGDLPRERTTYLEGHPLSLTDVTSSDSGLYVCEARNEAGFAKAAAMLKVVAAPFMAEKPSKVLSVEGQDAKLRCRVEADPEPLIVWKLPFHGSDSLLLKNNHIGKKVSVSTDGTSLSLKNLKLSDSGIYQCWGVSSGGGTSASASVLVVEALPPPIIGLRPQDQWTTSGTTVLFPCQAVSEYSQPSVTWWFQEASHLTSRQVKSSKGHLLNLETGSLTLKKVRKEDSGIYRCKVSSSSGSAEIEAILKVTEDLKRPNPRRGPLPAPPSQPKVVTFNRTSVRLTWSPNSRTFSTNETYTIEHWRAPWQEWRVVEAEIPNTSAVIAGLSPDVAYIFHVKAVNSRSEQSFPGPWSDFVYTEAQSTSVEGERSSARRLNRPLVVLTGARLSETGTVALSWELLAAADGEVDGVIVYWVGGERIASATVLGVSAASHVVTNLTSDTRYSFFVVPFWRTVEGVPSNSKTIFTPEQAPIVAPSDLKAEVIGASSALIRWEPLEDFRSLIGYKLSLSHNNVTKVKETPNTWFEAQGLVEGRFYTVQVAAVNKGGAGPWSSPSLIDLTGAAPSVNDSPKSELETPPSVLYAPPHPVWLLYLLVPVLIVLIIFILVAFLRRVKNKSGASENSSNGGPAFYSTTDQSTFRNGNMYGEQDKIWPPPGDSDQESSLSSAKLLRPKHIVNEYAEPRVTAGPYMMTALLTPSSPRSSEASWRRAGHHFPPDEKLPINWTDFLPPPPKCPPPSNLPLHSSMEGGSSATASDCSGDRRLYGTGGSSQYENAGDCESEQRYEKPCDIQDYSEPPYAVFTPIFPQVFSSTMQQQAPKVRVDLHPAVQLPKSNTH